MRDSVLTSIVALGLAAITTHGAIIATYNTKASFLARAGADGVTLAQESFEGLTATNAFDTWDIITPRVHVSSAPNSPKLGVWNQAFQGSHASDGVNYFSVATSPTKIQLTFDVPRTHFAFTSIDYGDTGSGILKLSCNGITLNVVDTHRNDGEEYFFGIVSDIPLASVILEATNVGDSFGIDNLFMGTVPSAGSAVPLLMLAGVIGRRRR